MAFTKPSSVFRRHRQEYSVYEAAVGLRKDRRDLENDAIYHIKKREKALREEKKWLIRLQSQRTAIERKEAADLQSLLQHALSPS